MKTTEERISKLYEGVSNEQKASLAFKYIIDKNSLEVARIQSTLKTYSYHCQDLEFRSELNRNVAFAGLWCLEWWRTQSDWLLAVAHYHVHKGVQSDQQDECEDSAIVAMELYCRRLIALENVLKAICARHGIDAEAVRKYGDVHTFNFGSKEMDEDFFDQILLMFEEGLFLL
jgi:hypothetical protein